MVSAYALICRSCALDLIWLRFFCEHVILFWLSLQLSDDEEERCRKSKNEPLSDMQLIFFHAQWARSVSCTKSPRFEVNSRTLHSYSKPNSAINISHRGIFIYPSESDNFFNLVDIFRRNSQGSSCGQDHQDSWMFLSLSDVVSLQILRGRKNYKQVALNQIRALNSSCDSPLQINRHGEFWTNP